jgi:hypothetical protein
MSAILSGGGISDYADFSSFGEEKVSGYTLRSCKSAKSAILEGRGIRLRTSQLPKRKVSNFGRREYQVTTKYQILTPFCVDCILAILGTILQNQHFQRHFASIAFSLF